MHLFHQFLQVVARFLLRVGRFRDGTERYQVRLVLSARRRPLYARVARVTVPPDSRTTAGWWFQRAAGCAGTWRRCRRHLARAARDPPLQVGPVLFERLRDGFRIVRQLGRHLALPRPYLFQLERFQAQRHGPLDVRQVLLFKLQVIRIRCHGCDWVCACVCCVNVDVMCDVCVRLFVFVMLLAV